MQNRFDGKPVTATVDPTFSSGSRAKVCDGTGGRRLLFWMLTSNVIETKQLRSNALLARRKLSAAERSVASQIIGNKITQSRDFKAAKFVACYLPMSDEVDTRPIIERAWRANKRVFVPITRKHRKILFREIQPDTILIQNSMMIWEPQTGDFISPRDLQFVVTPTVAFDIHNRRIGMGGGYYDRCFSFLRHRLCWLKPKLYGVAFECQRVEKISPNTWDIRLYRTFSESN